jgi:hypothetical protein
MTAPRRGARFLEGVVAWAGVVSAGVLAVATACARTPRPGAAALDPARLRFECGEAVRLSGAAFALRSACVRAVVEGEPRSAGAEIAFTYRGPTRNAEPLASGELRRQIGLKLRARDTCNVVYVMWHIEPTGGVFASVKANPDKASHAECGDRGYINLKPATRGAVSAIRPGERHTLGARIEGRVLRVTADGALAWEGLLPPEAFAFDGPVGIRSDNGEFDVELREIE